MTRYFETSAPSVNRDNNSNSTVAAADAAATNSATTTMMLQQLSAMQQQDTSSSSSRSQDEHMKRMIQMILMSQLATDTVSSSSTAPASVSARDHIDANRIMSAAVNVPFQRRFFEEERVRSNKLFHDLSPSMSSSRFHPQRQTMTKTQSHVPVISEHHQQWYSEERALLRELLVLTMRHMDGSLLRFVPSIDEQVELWNTHGHPVGERYAPNLVPEGVRLHPNITVIPEWNNNNAADDADANHVDNRANGNLRAYGVRDNIAFRAGLPMPLLGSGARDAISICGECGWLYGRVVSYVESILEDDEDGIHCSTARALATRLDQELAEYHTLLSLLESELPPLELTPSFIENAPNVRYLTLRSLASRLLPIKEHLSTLAILADGVGAYNLRGGKLLASLLRHSLDGYHPTSRRTKLVRSIAADCSIPWYNMLHQWMTQGVLEDIHSEFFIKDIRPQQMLIAAAGGGGNNHHDNIVTFSSGYYTWHQRYVLVDGQIPICSCGGLMDIMTIDLAREVLLVGKGINFIRYCLRDKDWELVETLDENEQEATEDGGCSSDHQRYNFVTLLDGTGDDQVVDESKYVSTLHTSVMISSARIQSHILESLSNNHCMMQHLLALKQFLLLGQGDFVSSFVESLHHEFRGRTSIAGIYSHTLSSLLEGSLRSTTARFLPNFVLGNIGARLKIEEHDANRYWMGPPPDKAKEVEMTPWADNSDASVQDPCDFIYLEYKIRSPLDAIVHASAMETYHHLFLFLFRLKRVEWMLNNSWRQSTALNHAILIETKAGGADAPAISKAAEHSASLLRRISSTRQTMLHFISNLQNYLMFEVLEGGWDGLVQSLSKATSLDDVIRAHDNYLSKIVDKTLLSINDNENTMSKSLEDLLQKLLSIALRFGKFQDHIFSNSIAGLDKAASIRKKVDERADKGDWGRTTLDTEEGRVFVYLADSKLFDFVDNTTREFDRTLSDLLKMMGKQIDEVDCNTSVDDEQEEADLVMRTNDALPFLLFRLDFSGYYARQAAGNRGKKR
jgi:gamma-tubulin complex component 3